MAPPGHAAGLGFPDELLHHIAAGHHAHAVVGIQYQGGGGVLQHLDFRDRLLLAGQNAVNVNGLQSVAAVCGDPAAVGLQQHIGAQLGVLAGQTGGLEGVRDKAFHQFPGDIDSSVHQIRLLYRITCGGFAG